MRQPVRRRQPWLLLWMVAAGFAILVFTDELALGLVLVVSGVFGGIGTLLWQAFTEVPREVDGPKVEYAPPRCCICDEAFDLDKPHARLNLTIEQVDWDAMIDTHDWFEVGACCQPACLQELWERLEGALPEGCTKSAEKSVEAFSRLKG